MKNNNYIALLLPNLEGGGAERISVKLANELIIRGYKVDMVLLSETGPFLELLHPQVRIVNLNVVRIRGLFPPLINYFKKNKPEVMLACMWPLTVMALASRILTFSSVRVVVAEHVTWSAEQRRYSSFMRLLIRVSMRIFFRAANGIIAVSYGAADDLARFIGMDRKSISVIYNPVVDSEFIPVKKLELSNFPRWNAAEFRVLTVGNLKDQKNHKLLLRAFSLLIKQNVQAHLLILGEGYLRDDLEALALELEIQGEVSMPGFVNDPTIYYQNANLFVLSSDWEGLPTVLIEALANGVPVVSTDCPSGPREILKDGQFGRLVSMGNDEALAKAMVNSFNDQYDSSVLKDRAQDFSVEKATDKYEKLLLGLS